MAGRLGGVRGRRPARSPGSRLRRGWPLGAAAVVLLGALAWLLVLRGGEAEPHLVLPTATATIGSGSDAVAVDAEGRVLGWLPLSEELQLPQLPLPEPPQSGHLRGPALEQARVLGAAPAALRPYLAASYHGEAGVVVELRSGIELRFGDASVAARKWRAVTAVLADSSITALDYVNVEAPRHPAVGGSGHALPAPP